MDNGEPDNCQLSIVNYQLILKKYWGYDDFRGIQRDIIESIGAGNDTLGLMPTGGGKSITFQVPAMTMQGVCLVITPLIALMKDQVTHLRQRGIKAAAIYSGMSHDDILRTLENAILGSTKFLYVSPERLGSDLFVTKLRHMQVCFITVDEAHCISQWGYDFRPSYLQIARIRDVMPQVPVLALTATATPQVIDDICLKLSPLNTRQSPPSPHSFHIFRMSFERKNLAYVVRHADDKMEELVHILTMTQGTAIVYVRSRKRSKEISTELNDNGISATYYHAGLDTADKDQRQHAWQTGLHRVMVATNAFGMGIDKADVRVVVHYDCPDSVEAYFQEAGRAGRDGQKAYAVLLYNSHEHAKLEKRVSDSYPEKDYIRQVYEHLAYYYQIATGDGYGVSREFSMEDFCRRFHHFPIRVHAALQILQRAGYIEYDEEQDNQARIHFLLERHDLYRLSQLTPREDRVIETLLRNYGGLFADYEFVDESLLAQLSARRPTSSIRCSPVCRSVTSCTSYPASKCPTYAGYSAARTPSISPCLPVSMKTGAINTSSASTACCNMPNEKTTAGHACCWNTSERPTPTTASSATSVCSTGTTARPTVPANRSCNCCQTTSHIPWSNCEDYRLTPSTSTKHWHY